jgi:beta-N-acetylhexosaminidase
MTPIIFGLEGTRLTDDERALFRAANPAGYIMFARNVADRAQLRALTDDLRSLSGRDDLAILIDQEGGRVARMKPPEWPAFPAGAAFDRLYDVAPASAIAAARANAHAIAVTLAEVGISVDCLPLLDVRQPGASEVIGDRALGGDPLRVAALGRAVLQGLRDGGVVGVVKHMPGHGRAAVDSHHDLPVVTASETELAGDIAPFAALTDAPMAMSAHVVYTAWDAENCATQSPFVIGEIIRKRIGFDGLLMTDDLDMKALTGTLPDRAERSLRAGCDVGLHCSGVFADMAAIVERVGGGMSAVARARLDRAMERAAPPAHDAQAAQLAALTEKRDTLLALV